MNFKECFANLKAANKVPFGTPYEYLAREVWNVAIEAEREDCAKIADEDEDGYFIAAMIRERSKVDALKVSTR
jgi:flagellar motility protein MotE (MotC chaperone)